MLWINISGETDTQTDTNTFQEKNAKQFNFTLEKLNKNPCKEMYKFFKHNAHLTGACH